MLPHRPFIKWPLTRQEWVSDTNQESGQGSQKRDMSLYKNGQKAMLLETFQTEIST